MTAIPKYIIVNSYPCPRAKGKTSYCWEGIEYIRNKDGTEDQMDDCSVCKGQGFVLGIDKDELIEFLKENNDG